MSTGRSSSRSRQPPSITQAGSQREESGLTPSEQARALNPFASNLSLESTLTPSGEALAPPPGATSAATTHQGGTASTGGDFFAHYGGLGTSDATPAVQHGNSASLSASSASHYQDASADTGHNALDTPTSPEDQTSNATRQLQNLLIPPAKRYAELSSAVNLSDNNSLVSPEPTTARSEVVPSPLSTNGEELTRATRYSQIESLDKRPVSPAGSMSVSPSDDSVYATKRQSQAAQTAQRTIAAAAAASAAQKQQVEPSATSSRPAAQHARKVSSGSTTTATRRRLGQTEMASKRRSSGSVEEQSGAYIDAHGRVQQAVGGQHSAGALSVSGISSLVPAARKRTLNRAAVAGAPGNNSPVIPNGFQQTKAFYGIGPPGSSANQSLESLHRGNTVVGSTTPSETGGSDADHRSLSSRSAGAGGPRRYSGSGPPMPMPMLNEKFNPRPHTFSMVGFDSAYPPPMSGNGHGGAGSASVHSAGSRKHLLYDNGGDGSISPPTLPYGFGAAGSGSNSGAADSATAYHNSANAWDDATKVHSSNGAGMLIGGKKMSFREIVNMTSVNPFSWDIMDGKPEPDDDLHDPRKLDDDSRKGKAGAWNMRGVLNIGSVAVLVMGLLALFAGYPIISHYVRRGYSTQGGYGLGGTNASGQVSSVPGIRTTLIDPDTPQAAMTRQGSDGETYKLVFSDEFTTDGRSFYPGDDPYWTAVDLHYCEIHFHS